MRDFDTAHRRHSRIMRFMLIFNFALVIAILIGAGFGLLWLIDIGLPALGEYLLRLKAA